MRLGIAEFSLPGQGLEEKLQTAEHKRLWIEVANDGVPWKCWRWKSLLPSYRVRVRSVQAFLQHRLSLLSKSEVERKAALNHVIQTIEFASLVSAKHVVVVLCYGKPEVEDADEQSVRALGEMAKVAEDAGITLGLEPLDHARTNYRPTTEAVWEIVKLVNNDHLKLMIDTGHAWNNGENVVEILERFRDVVSEIHLKDSESKAPGLGALDFEPIVNVCANAKGLKCLEYCPRSNPTAELEKALQTVAKLKQ